jgi:hypothetical protein
VELYLCIVLKKREFKKLKPGLELWVLGVSLKNKIKTECWWKKLVGESWGLGRVKIG